MGCCLCLLEEGVKSAQPSIRDTLYENKSLVVLDRDFKVSVATARLIDSISSPYKYAVFSVSSRPSVSVPVTVSQWKELKRFVEQEKPPSYSFFPYKNTYRLVAHFPQSGLFVFPPLSTDPVYKLDNATHVKLPSYKLRLSEMVVMQDFVVTLGDSKLNTLTIISLLDSSVINFKVKLLNGPLKDDPVVRLLPVCGTSEGELFVVTHHKKSPLCFGAYVVTRFSDEGVAFAEAVGSGMTYAKQFAPLSGGKVMLLQTGRYDVVDIRRKTVKTISENASLLSSWYMDGGSSLIRLDEFFSDVQKFSKVLKYAV